MAKIIKLKIGKDTGKKPLTALQKMLLKGPTMSDKQWEEYKRQNKRMAKWKISQ